MMVKERSEALPSLTTLPAKDREAAWRGAPDVPSLLFLLDRHGKPVEGTEWTPPDFRLIMPHGRHRSCPACFQLFTATSPGPQRGAGHTSAPPSERSL